MKAVVCGLVALASDANLAECDAASHNREEGFMVQGIIMQGER